MANLIRYFVLIQKSQPVIETTPKLSVFVYFPRPIYSNTSTRWQFALADALLTTSSASGYFPSSFTAGRSTILVTPPPPPPLLSLSHFLFIKMAPSPALTMPAVPRASYHPTPCAVPSSTFRVALIPLSPCLTLFKPILATAFKRTEVHLKLQEYGMTSKRS